MKKIDPAVIKESKYIAVWVVLLSVLMEAVFLIIGMWDYTVLLGNLLIGVTVILNFFLMGLSIQNALEKEEKEAKNTLKLSRTYRMLMLFVVIVVGVVLPVFNMWAVVIPVLFPRVAIAFRVLFNKKDT